MVLPRPRGPARAEQTLTDSAVHPRDPLAPDHRIGRYRILHTLGSGGMGTVYAADDPDLDRTIAIKVMHEHRSNHEALVREAQAMAQFSHPNVVTVHDVGTHDGRVFLAMDWVRGPTLRRWMRGRHWGEVLRVLLDAGRGLAAVHAAGLVHRDFKPANVMLHPGGRVVVMDFGLARSVDATSRAFDSSAHSERTHDDAASGAGSVQGTPAYMAPEQHLGLDVDARADQFSFCVAAFEALYGTRPFRAKTVPELVVRISGGDLTEVPRNGVPRRIHRALLRGLAEVPSKRWPSMDALLDQLEPGARGTWMLWAAAGATAATLGFAALSPANTCTQRGDAVRALWTKGQRDSLRAALHDSDKPFAPETAAKVESTLDTYVAELASASDMACTQPLEANLLDRRTACLHQRTAAFRGTLAALARHGNDKPDRAMQVVGQLQSVDACLDAESLAQSHSLPADEGLRERTREARTAIAEARALELTGDLEAAHQRAAEALVVARQSHHAPVEAEALTAWASTLDARGSYSEAADAFEAAFHIARGARHDVEALRAAVELVYVLGYRLQQREAAQAWIRRSHALLGHVHGDRAQSWEARLINNEATLAYNAGDYGSAAKGFERTARLREQLRGPDHHDVAAAHSNLGLVLTRMGEHARALEHHARARSSWEASLGPSHPMVAISVHNRAYVLESLQRYGEAASEYETAIELRKRSQGPAHPSVALSINNLGNVRRAQGRLLDALELHQEALALWHRAHGPEHRRVAEALSAIAQDLQGQGRFEEAHRFADRSLTALEVVVGPDHPDYALALFLRGLICADEGDVATARLDMQNARRVLVASWGPDNEHVLTLDESLAELPSG